MRILQLYFTVLALALFIGCGKASSENTKNTATGDGQKAAAMPNNGAALVGGDSSSVEAATDGEYTDESRLMELISRADQTFYEGNTNDALLSLETALVDPAFAYGRTEIIRSIIGIELRADMTDKARERMFALYENEITVAEALCGTIYYNFRERGDLEGAVAWTERVLALSGLTPSVKSNMREWNFLTYIALGDTDKVASLARGFVADAPAGNALKILRRGTDDLFNKKNYSALEAVLAKISGVITTDKETNNFISLLRLRLYAMQGKWEQYLKLFPSALAKCGDSELSTLLRRSLPVASKSRSYATVDLICETVITNSVFHRMSYEYAARQWLDSAQATDCALVPERIDFLFNSGKQIDEVASLFIYHGYDMIDDVEFVADMKTIGERLVSAVPNVDLRGSVKTIVLDYSFVSKDYDTALKMLESGIGDNDKLWHDMSIAKVKGHKALAEGKALDAVKNFRLFMSLLQSSEDSEAEEDPATGVIHTREMILGRNAKRIGDIYASINDAAMAASAYNEARDYYKKTLATETDPDTLAIAKREYDAIPLK